MRKEGPWASQLAGVWEMTKENESTRRTHLFIKDLGGNTRSQLYVKEAGANEQVDWKYDEAQKTEGTDPKNPMGSGDQCQEWQQLEGSLCVFVWGGGSFC